MLSKLLGFVFNRWVLGAALLLALALLIWIVGPLVAIAQWRPLESGASRWITVGLIVAVTTATIAWKRWRARRSNAAVVQQLSTASQEPQATESADLTAVRGRFEQAMRTLKRARFGQSGALARWLGAVGGRYLYQLPWYLMIGAPGSGKTTALHHCGLSFPLANQVGDYAVRGVGGTRHCDWWFADQAVLLDTAGRFTTQDSDRDNDRATWSGFLAMLKRWRPRQPINGVLLTVSVTDLIARNGAERQQHAAAVRQRLQELHEGLGIRFPIYLLVTKADLLAGFMDSFALLDKQQRATPWGATFSAGGGAAASLRCFSAEFEALRKRLDDGLVERLQGERDPQRRARIYGFAAQFAGLGPLLQQFLDTVFSPSPYEAEPLLRGVYFVSGTQEGTPIDRVLGAVARNYRLERAVIAPNQSSGKSYFLSRLLGEVVFAESGLAGTDPKLERRRAMLVAGCYAALGVLALGAIGVWTLSYLNNRRYVDDVAQRTEHVRQAVQATPNRASADVLPIVPALQATRGLAGEGPVPWTLGFGLHQGPKLDSAARSAYERMLVDAVTPRIGLRVEEQLREAGVGPDSEYETLKAYLMLHDTQHFDAGALRTYVEADWDARFGRSLTANQRAELSSHLDALLAQGATISPMPEDKGLVQTHRAHLAQVSLAQRVFNRLRRQGLGAEFPEFSVVRAGGRNAPLAFVRASGAPLTQGVPGLFSYNGYHRGFQRQVARVAGELAAEQAWVLGIAETPKDALATVRAGEPLVEEVRRIYLSEYAAAWESFIADVRLVPLTSLAQSIQTARLLSAPDSPLPPLLKAMAQETTLAASSGRNLLDKAERVTKGAIDRSREAVIGLIDPKKADPNQPPLEQLLVDDRFIGLHRFVSAPEGGKPPIDDAIALIAEVHVLLNAADSAVKGGAAPPPSPTPLKVKSEAARMPDPLRSMMEALSDNSAHVSQTLVRQNLGKEVRSAIGEFCAQAMAGRYPLDRGSTRDVTQADFAMLFGPGGKFDQFFQQKLATYVDTTARPWRFRAVDGVPLGSDPGSLPQFQRAQTIRETFFANGSTPTLRLQFKPIEMDASLKLFILDVDGQIVRYDHGPQIPTVVQWPGPRGTQQVRVEVSPPGSASTFGMLQGGPWALMRLFDHVTIDTDKPKEPEHFRVTFDIDGRKAVFEVMASSVRNPFRLRELGEFACPMGL